MGVKKIYTYWWMLRHVDGTWTPVSIIATGYCESKKILNNWKKEQKFNSPIYQSIYCERIKIKRKEHKEKYKEYLSNMEKYGYDCVGANNGKK